MKTLPTTAFTWLFTRLPGGAVALAAAALAVLFVGDVAIPDFLPFVDEALLAYLLTGAMTELRQRRRARAGGAAKVDGAPVEAAPVKAASTAG